MMTEKIDNNGYYWLDSETHDLSKIEVGDLLFFYFSNGSGECCVYKIDVVYDVDEIGYTVYHKMEYGNNCTNQTNSSSEYELRDKSANDEHLFIINKKELTLLLLSDFDVGVVEQIVSSARTKKPTKVQKNGKTT